MAKVELASFLSILYYILNFNSFHVSKPQLDIQDIALNAGIDATPIDPQQKWENEST